MLGKIEGRRRRGLQRMRGLHGIINSMDMSLRKLREIMKDREAWLGPLNNNSISNKTLVSLFILFYDAFIFILYWKIPILITFKCNDTFLCN